MPEIPNPRLVRFGRVTGELREGAYALGRAIKPAVGPLAVGGAVLLGFTGIEAAINAWGAAQNPPAQTGTIPYGMPKPNDGSGGQEGYFFDPRTGRTFFFGAPPVAGSGPDRSTERTTNYLLLAAAAVAVVLIVTRGK